MKNIPDTLGFLCFISAVVGIAWVELSLISEDGKLGRPQKVPALVLDI